MSQSTKFILITGAGIASPIIAYFLSRSPTYHIMIVERSPSLRSAGQIIDVRGSALTVLERMGHGVLDAIRAKTTQEEGFELIDSYGKLCGSVSMKDGGGKGFTAEIEIARREIVEMLYGASLTAETEEDVQKRGSVKYIFDDHITGIVDGGDKVTVTFAKAAVQAFDLVIGADGLSSKTRELVFGNVPRNDLGAYISFFQIPQLPTDGTWSKVFHAPGGRVVMLRPDGIGGTRAYLSIVSSKPSGFEKLDTKDQKALTRELFQDAGWELTRILDGMDAAEDFYMTSITQIKMPAWSSGRVVLVGDAAYCPSPLSGMGTTLAITGAYILAGEIVRCENHVEAFKAYETAMRPYVEKAQKLPPGAITMGSPQTKWGVALFNGIVGFAARSGFASFLMAFANPPADGLVLPEYES